MLQLIQILEPLNENVSTSQTKAGNLCPIELMSSIKVKILYMDVPPRNIQIIVIKINDQLRKIYMLQKFALVSNSC